MKTRLRLLVLALAYSITIPPLSFGLAFDTPTTSLTIKGIPEFVQTHIRTEQIRVKSGNEWLTPTSTQSGKNQVLVNFPAKLEDAHTVQLVLEMKTGQTFSGNYELTFVKYGSQLDLDKDPKWQAFTELFNSQNTLDLTLTGIPDEIAKNLTSYTAEIKKIGLTWVNIPAMPPSLNKGSLTFQFKSPDLDSRNMYQIVIHLKFKNTPPITQLLYLPIKKNQAALSFQSTPELARYASAYFKQAPQPVPPTSPEKAPPTSPNIAAAKPTTLSVAPQKPVPAMGTKTAKETTASRPAPPLPPAPVITPPISPKTTAQSSATTAIEIPSIGPISEKQAAKPFAATAKPSTATISAAEPASAPEKPATSKKAPLSSITAAPTIAQPNKAIQIQLTGLPDALSQKDQLKLELDKAGVSTTIPPIQVGKQWIATVPAAQLMPGHYMATLSIQSSVARLREEIVIGNKPGAYTLDFKKEADAHTMTLKLKGSSSAQLKTSNVIIQKGSLPLPMLYRAPAGDAYQFMGKPGENYALTIKLNNETVNSFERVKLMATTTFIISQKTEIPAIPKEEPVKPAPKPVIAQTPQKPSAQPAPTPTEKPTEKDEVQLNLDSTDTTLLSHSKVTLKDLSHKTMPQVSRSQDGKTYVFKAVPNTEYIVIIEFPGAQKAAIKLHKRLSITPRTVFIP